jgi:predicted RNA-binding Zn-ribbon protein involved in translation (DUF1610 family)
MTIVIKVVTCTQCGFRPIVPVEGNSHAICPVCSTRISTRSK